MSKSAIIIGAGLAGATLAHELARLDVSTTTYEAAYNFGGLSRSDTSPHGVIFEPHGSHIFHTDDREVWELVSNLVPFWRYEHSVITMVRGRRMTWPIQMDEVREVYGEDVAESLRVSNTPGIFKNQSTPPMFPNFEEWCRGIMPAEVYEDFVRPYTEKQWGVPASELSAEFAPKRVQVRTDGDKRLFKDQYQGYPDAREGGSYDALHRALWRGISDLRLGSQMDMTKILGVLAGGPKVDCVFLTCPLDVFAHHHIGTLPWRGLTFEHRFISTDDAGFVGGHAQDAMVVNWPAKDWPFIRTHETKHASRQAIGATVLTTEFPGGPGRYYPVPRREPDPRELNEKYKDYIRKVVGPVTRVEFVGRLATYRYQDQDDVIRDALDAAREVFA